MKKNRKAPDTRLTDLERIKKLVVIAMFSDDELMERLVLKGGNALDLIHRISTRASLDLDFSMERDFAVGERDASSLSRFAHNCRSNRRYMIASLTCSDPMCPSPARSEMVRATRRILSWARADRPSSVRACLSSCSPAASSVQYSRSDPVPSRPSRVAQAIAEAGPLDHVQNGSHELRELVEEQLPVADARNFTFHLNPKRRPGPRKTA